jgi:Tfp pilus assembly protein PilF
MRNAMGIIVLAALAASAAGTPAPTTPTAAASPAQAKLKRAYDLLKAGRKADALTAFNTVLKLEPRNVTALTEVAYIKESSKRWAEAAKYLKAASVQQPENLRLHMDLGYALQAAKDLKGAEAEFRLVAKEPGEFQEQAAAALKIVESVLSPGQTAASFAEQDKLIKQGYAALRQGDRAKARARFRQVLEIDGRNLAALKQVGYLDLEDGKLAEAAEAFELVAKIQPQDYTAALQLGYIYDKLHDDAKARESFGRALASSDAKTHDAAAAALKAGGGVDVLESGAPESAPVR